METHRRNQATISHRHYLWICRVVLPFITVANILLSITTHEQLSRRVGFPLEDDGQCHSKKLQHLTPRSSHLTERNGGRGTMMESKNSLKALSEDLKELEELFCHQNITDEKLEHMMRSKGPDFGRITDCPTEDCRIPGGLEGLLQNCSELLQRNPGNDDDSISENHERNLPELESDLHNGSSKDNAWDTNMKSSNIHSRLGALNMLIDEGLDKQWEITQKYGSNSSEWEIHTRKMAQRAGEISNGILGSIMGAAGQSDSPIGAIEERNAFMKQVFSAILSQNSTGATNSTEK